jgi:2-hydroxychromene-2-carboxylate isomerase
LWKYSTNKYQKYVSANPSLTPDPIFKVQGLFGFVNANSGNEDKDKWIEVERLRWARLFSVPMAEKQPEGFPPLTLPIMRAMCALTVLHPGKEAQGPLIRCLDVLYPAMWVDHRKTNEKDVLADILNGVLGVEESQKGEPPLPYPSPIRL